MLKALIVDDEEDIGLMVARFLKKEGLEADYVNRIQKAKEKIINGDYNFFFLDLNLPDGTGFDLVPDIKSHNNDPKVVIISAFDGINETKKANEMGVDIFIKKPFTKNEVLEAVRDLT